MASDARAGVPSEPARIMRPEPESLVASYPATAKALPALACPQDTCDGSYTCSCPLHEAERAYRVQRGVKAPPRQPWQKAA